MPDFGPYIIATVCIDNMSASRKENFSECNIVCAKNWNLINYLGCSSWTEETAAAIELLFATGMRIYELCSLKINDINLDNGTILILVKGSKERILQIGSS